MARDISFCTFHIANTRVYTGKEGNFLLKRDLYCNVFVEAHFFIAEAALAICTQHIQYLAWYSIRAFAILSNRYTEPTRIPR